MATSKTLQLANKVFAEHRELTARTRNLKSFLKKERPAVASKDSYRWAASLSEHLLRMHNRLAQHYATEEGSGLFEELAERFPRAGPGIDRLVAEHERNLTDLRCLIDETLLYAEGRPPKNARLRNRVGSLLSRMTTHENREMELRQRLYNEELGAAD